MPVRHPRHRRARAPRRRTGTRAPARPPPRSASGNARPTNERAIVTAASSRAPGRSSALRTSCSWVTSSKSICGCTPPSPNSSSTRGPTSAHSSRISSSERSALAVHLRGGPPVGGDAVEPAREHVVAHAGQVGGHLAHRPLRAGRHPPVGDLRTDATEERGDAVPGGPVRLGRVHPHPALTLGSTLCPWSRSRSPDVTRRPRRWASAPGPGATRPRGAWAATTPTSPRPRSPRRGRRRPRPA